MPMEEREGIRVYFTMEFDFNELGQPSKLKFSDVKPGDGEEIIRITNELRRNPTTDSVASTKHVPSPPTTPMLSDVIDDFIAKCQVPHDS